jgi:hypothetical protein
MAAKSLHSIVRKDAEPYYTPKKAAANVSMTIERERRKVVAAKKRVVSTTSDMIHQLQPKTTKADEEMAAAVKRLQEMAYVPATSLDKRGLPIFTPDFQTVYSQLANVANGHVACVAIPLNILDVVPMSATEGPLIQASAVYRAVFPGAGAVKTQASKQQHQQQKSVSADQRSTFIRCLRKVCMASNLVYVHASTVAADTAIVFSKTSVGIRRAAMLSIILMGKDRMMLAGIKAARVASPALLHMAIGRSDEDIANMLAIRALQEVLLVDSIGSAADDAGQGYQSYHNNQYIKDATACCRIHRRYVGDWLQEVRNVYNMILASDMVDQEAQRIQADLSAFPPVD